ncbi:MAG: aldo/keto reductase, partial [Anaerolineales bacterium]
GHLESAMTGAWPALLEARKEGTAGKIGMGVNNGESYLDFLEAGLKPEVLLLAGRYTLIEQGVMDSVFPAALVSGTEIWLGGVFNSGILATGNKPTATYNYVTAPANVREKAERLNLICRYHGVSLGAAALQFAAANPAAHTCLLGPETVQELQECLEWLHQPIRGDFWQELKRQWEIEGTAPVPVWDAHKAFVMPHAAGKAEPA